MKLNRVHHIAIIAADYQASKSFYCGNGVLFRPRWLTDGTRRTLIA
ncbi:MAG TPA: hypothetical protein VIJ00_05010 [Nakamurella sp.]